MNVIDGKAIAKEIQKEIKREIAAFPFRKPGLAFILVGHNPASETYVKMKKKGCLEVGIYSETLELPPTISEKELLKHIDELNQSPLIDGILVQLPLPSHISSSKIFEAIHPEKDVDGFHPYNMGKLLLGEQGGFVACTPLGIVTLLEKTKIETQGKHIVIIGRSNIVGKPLAALLIQKRAHCNATVTIAHSASENLEAICKTADILIASIGSPHFITKPMVKKGTIVIDVGINRIHDEKGGTTLVGDVAFDEVKEIASFITPVPGGVGPMTIAMLLSNTLKSFKKRNPNSGF